MPNPTHCLPAGVLGASQLDVYNISSSVIATQTPAGSKRGVVVLLPGLGNSIQPLPPVINNTGGFLPIRILDLANALTADGWVFLYVNAPETAYGGISAVGLFNAIQADPGFGSQYLATCLAMWDHYVLYCQATYGAGIPIVPVGVSMGGWWALQIAANRYMTVPAAGAHIYVTIMSHISFPPVNFGTLNTTGMDAKNTIVNTFPKPLMLSWHTDDFLVPPADSQAVDTAAVASGVPAVTTFTGTGSHSLNATDVTNITNWFAASVDPICPKVF